MGQESEVKSEQNDDKENKWPKRIIIKKAGAEYVIETNNKKAAISKNSPKICE